MQRFIVLQVCNTRLCLVIIVISHSLMWRLKLSHSSLSVSSSSSFSACHNSSLLHSTIKTCQFHKSVHSVADSGIHWTVFIWSDLCLLFSATCGECMSCLCLEQTSVSSSVTLVNCDHIVQDAVEFLTLHERAITLVFRH